MEVRDQQLRQIWEQKHIPVVFRQTKPDPLLIRLPFAKKNREWLKGSKKRNPKWDGQRKRWETPVAWFNDVIKRSLERYGSVYVIQLHKEMQKCAPACWNAEGFDCECSCMGARHGEGYPGHNWHEISETFAFSWDTKTYACRLIKAKQR